MFKNFDKVFKFTFKNQTSTKGYKYGTIITALILFIIPVAIFVISGMALDDKKDTLESCGAERVYVVDPEAPDTTFFFITKTPSFFIVYIILNRQHIHLVTYNMLPVLVSLFHNMAGG